METIRRSNPVILFRIVRLPIRSRTLNALLSSRFFLYHRNGILFQDFDPRDPRAIIRTKVFIILVQTVMERFIADMWDLWLLFSLQLPIPVLFGPKDHSITKHTVLSVV